MRSLLFCLEFSANVGDRHRRDLNESVFTDRAAQLGQPMLNQALLSKNSMLTSCLPSGPDITSIQSPTSRLASQRQREPSDRTVDRFGLDGTFSAVIHLRCPGRRDNHRDYGHGVSACGVKTMGRAAL